MPAPLVEIYAPQRHGNMYAVAARLGELELCARVPAELVHKWIAKFRALASRFVRYHHEAGPTTRTFKNWHGFRPPKQLPLRLPPRHYVGADPEGWSSRNDPWRQQSYGDLFEASSSIGPIDLGGGAMLDAASDPFGPLMLTNMAPSDMGMVAGDEVGNFWNDLGTTVGKITRTPAFKAVTKAAVTAIPYVGPIIAAANLDGMAIDAAGAAVDNAIAKAEGKGGGGAAQAAARTAIKHVQKKAKRGNRKARRAHKVLKAAAQAYKAHGRKGVVMFRGLGRAAELVRRANAGNSSAQDKIQDIYEDAADGDEAMIQAAAFIEAARAAIAEAPERDIDDDDDEEVGARMRRAMSDHELLLRARAYRARRAGWRPSRRAA